MRDLRETIGAIKNNALEVIKNYDLVCDCTDNFPSRYLINDACVILGKPNIHGSIARFEGQATVFNLNKISPNYRDLIPDPPPPGLLPSCAEGGVVGVLPGLIGVIQATEAIKIITGIGKPLCGRLLIFDALSMTFKELSLKPNPHKKRIDKLIDYEEFCAGKSSDQSKVEALSIANISVRQLHEKLENDHENILLLDVRNPEEYDLGSIRGATLMPLHSIENGEAIEIIREMVTTRQLYIYCKSGKRSIKALIKLKRHKINGINVSGGIDSWNLEILPKLRS